MLDALGFHVPCRRKGEAKKMPGHHRASEIKSYFINGVKRVIRKLP